MTKLQAGHYLHESLTCMRVGLIHQRHTDRCSKDTDDVMMGIRQRRFGGNEWVRDHFATKNEIIDPDISSEDELVPILLRSHGKMRFPDENGLRCVIFQNSRPPPAIQYMRVLESFRFGIP